MMIDDAPNSQSTVSTTMMSTPVSDFIPPPISAGEVSPRSPLECDFDNIKTLSSRKAVRFASTPSCKRISAPLGSEGEAQPSSKRKVSWNNKVVYKEIRHIHDFTNAEIEQLWMTVPEYERIKLRVKQTVRMMMKGESIDEIEFSARGLEFRTRNGSRIRSVNKLRTRSAVLNEQDLQREEGFSDPEFIAMASIDESLPCRQDAQQRAVHDAKLAEEHLRDIRDLYR